VDLHDVFVFLLNISEVNKGVITNCKSKNDRQLNGLMKKQWSTKHYTNIYWAI